jgi:hypothetical protein
MSPARFPASPVSRRAAALAAALLGLAAAAAAACSAGGPSGTAVGGPASTAAAGPPGTAPAGPPGAAPAGPPGVAAGGPPSTAASSGPPVGAVLREGGGPSGAVPASPPVLSPAADPALIEWRRPATVPGGGPPAAPLPGRPAAPRGTAPRERVSIGLGGLWIGPENPEDGPRVHYLFARRRRSDDLSQLVHAFAPFQLPAPGGEAREQDGELTFRGRGAAEAPPAERRMIAEWTRAVTVEAAGDSGSPSLYGLAFTWHRGAVAGGVCDDLAVYLSGEVSAGSCGAGAEIGGRLAGERLQRLYGWVDGLAAFQDAGEQGVRADALLERLIFAGRGRRAASREDVAAIEAFAGALHHELTISGTGAAEATAVAVQRPPAGVPRRPTAAESSGAPPPAGSRSNRPPRASIQAPHSGTAEPPPADAEPQGPPPGPGATW